MSEPTGPATQVRHPWRTTARTIAQGVGTVLLSIPALYVLAPDILRAAGLEAVPWAVAALGVLGAIARVMAVPGVEQWMRRNFPWLAAKP